MPKSITLCLAGQQGEGINVLGKILSNAIQKHGYYIFGYRSFSSRIKGGSSSYSLGISDTPIQSSRDNIDLLLSLDESGIEQHRKLLHNNSIVVIDEKLKNNIPHPLDHYSFPFTLLGKELGNDLYKNMVSLGTITKLLPLSPDIVKDTLHEIFGKKEKPILEKNLQAFDIGYHLPQEEIKINLPKILKKKDTIILTGNTALSIGLLAGGCRFMASYPITPASEIMEFMAKKLPSLGGAIIQSEDEISAISMAIGASYAGIRSATATSGPGFSLMTEAMGLSSMAEIPLVLVNVQRAGPSTGMPTKQEQSDLSTVLYSGHGEFPRIVLSPGNPEECILDGIKALNLADFYQCPVIIQSDLQLGLSEYTTPLPSYDWVQIHRGKIVQQEVLQERETSNFPRYAITEDGISPRTLPGQKNGLFYTTGVEHDEWGYTNTTPETRVKMHDKRMKKLKNVEIEDSYIHHQGNGNILMIGYGSTKGILEEIFITFSQYSHPIDTLQLRVLLPFPKDSIGKLLTAYDKIVFIENNATQQLYHLFRQYLSMDQNIEIFHKYDGTFINVDEVIEFLKRRVL